METIQIIPFWWKLILMGVSAGVASGLFGIGGGIIIVPLLIFALDYNQKTATAISLVALLLPVGILAVREYFNNKIISSVEIQAGLWISIGLFLGALFGAKIAMNLSNQMVSKMFAVFLVLVAIRVWLKASQ